MSVDISVNGGADKLSFDYGRLFILVLQVQVDVSATALHGDVSRILQIK